MNFKQLDEKKKADAEKAFKQLARALMDYPNFDQTNESRVVLKVKDVEITMANCVGLFLC